MTRVLVVDDDATIRSVVSELLHNEGHVVDSASDGAHALHCAHDTPPAAILLDLMMSHLPRAAAARWSLAPRLGEPAVDRPPLAKTVCQAPDAEFS